GTGEWYHSGPWGAFTTKSVSFNGAGTTSRAFTFLSPRRLVQLDAHNGNGAPTTVTLSCPGQPNQQATLAGGQVATISTGWTGTCTTVTLSSTNGWDTNFDNLVLSGAAAPSPTATPPRPLPDLEITSFTAASGPANQPLPVSVTIANQGTADAGYFEPHVYADAPPPTPAPLVVHFEVPSLAAGASVTLSGSVAAGQLAEGQHTLWVDADGHGVITESDKTNNVASAAMRVDPPSTATPTATPEPGAFSPVRLNAGGGAYMGADGRSWAADSGFSGGLTYAVTAPISDTNDDTLYQTERYGTFSYTLPALNGSYTVTLKFAEIFHTAPGQRVFHADLEGQRVLTDFDILAEVSPNTALDKTFTATVADGQLDIAFTTVRDAAKVAAIEVLAGRASSPTATPTTPPVSGDVTVTFDDRPGQFEPLDGQYPSGVIDWGSGQWYHSGPWGSFTTKSVSFNGGGVTSRAFTFGSPRRLVSLRAYNGGSGPSTVTLSCAGQPPKQATVAAGQVATISTGWTGTCSTVTLGSSNGWDTNFDDLVLDGDAIPNPSSTAQPSSTATRTATATATPTRTPTATPTPLPVTVTFDDRPGQFEPLDGQYPSGVIDWGSGQWYHSGPWGAFTTKSVSLFSSTARSATFTFVTPRRLLRLDAYNGESGPSTVTLSCPGQPDVQATLSAGQVATINTGWTGACTTVTIGSSNGWNTNFDDLVISGA
ncbi:MAG: malectin domain-containing carbohydrate-binding protein, partial [Chloroflexota bacterium]